MSKILAAFALCLATGCTSALEDPTVDPGAAQTEEGAAQKDAVLVPREAQLSGPRLRVTLVDVGQGDAVVVELPGGRTLVIDGGPSSDGLADHLRDRGIDRLDYAVLTHAHDDHYTGLVSVLSLLPGDCKRRVLDPGYNRDSDGYQAFREAAGCRYGAVGAGQSLLLDPAVQIDVLTARNRPDPLGSTSHGVNNTSVVLRLRYRDFSILLGGDAENEAEAEAYMKAGMRLRSTVLKLGHHGSCTASGTTFLKAVAPRTLLISAGNGNSYGLPHCQTMDKLSGLRSRGARWYRTDANGTISVASDGTRYTVTPQRGAEGVTRCPRDCAEPQDF